VYCFASKPDVPGTRGKPASGGVATIDGKISIKVGDCLARVVCDQIVASGQEFLVNSTPQPFDKGFPFTIELARFVDFCEGVTGAIDFICDYEFEQYPDLFPFTGGKYVWSIDSETHKKRTLEPSNITNTKKTKEQAKEEDVQLFLKFDEYNCNGTQMYTEDVEFSRDKALSTLIDVFHGAKTLLKRGGVVPPHTPPSSSRKSRGRTRRSNAKIRCRGLFFLFFLRNILKYNKKKFFIET